MFDAILCSFCGFEARESGFLSLNFWLAQEKINRERKQGLQAETRPGSTFPEKNGIRPTRIHKQVPVTERAVFRLRLGQISVQFVREWPLKCGPNFRLWPKFNFFLWSGRAANSKECKECSFPLKFEFTCDKSPPLSSRGETVCLQQTLHWRAPERWVWSIKEPSWKLQTWWLRLGWAEKIFRYQNKQILLILSVTLAVKQNNKQTNKQFSVLALGVNHQWDQKEKSYIARFQAPRAGEQQSSGKFKTSKQKLVC